MHLHVNSPRRLIGAAAMACAAALIPVAALAATATPATPAAGTPGCTTSRLVIWFGPQFGGGYAGGYGYNLNFTNLSGHACTLRGSPGVSAVNLSGHQLGRAASGDYSGKTPAVRLANGATATALVQVTDTGVYGGRGLPCEPVTAAGVRVYPPNQFASKVAPYPFSACSHAGPVYMSVGPVKKDR
jgi:hypothetical protein